MHLDDDDDEDNEMQYNYEDMMEEIPFVVTAVKDMLRQLVVVTGFTCNTDFVGEPMERFKCLEVAWRASRRETASTIVS